jgi:uncharacterized membrane protein YecN with MAPEG domain
MENKKEEITFNQFSALSINKNGFFLLKFAYSYIKEEGKHCIGYGDSRSLLSIQVVGVLARVCILFFRLPVIRLKGAKQ